MYMHGSGSRPDASRHSHRPASLTPLPILHTQPMQPAHNDFRRLSSPPPCRRPLRSSPLAGPVLSHERIDEGRQYRNLASSTPDLPSHFIKKSVPVNPRRKSVQPRRFAPPHSMSSPTHIHSAPSTPPEWKRKNVLRKIRAPVDGGALAALSSSLRRLNHSNSKLPSASSTSLSTASTSTTSDSLPSGSSTPPIVTTRCPSLIPTEASRQVTFQPLAEIPRFTRLGIKAPNVVMPLSAKEYHSNRVRQRQQAPPPPEAARLAPPPSPHRSTRNLSTPHYRRSRSYGEAVVQMKGTLGPPPPPPCLLRQASGSSASSVPMGESESLREIERLPSLTRSSGLGSSDDDGDSDSLYQTPSSRSAASTVSDVPGALDTITMVSKRDRLPHSRRSSDEGQVVLVPPRKRGVNMEDTVKASPQSSATLGGGGDASSVYSDDERDTPADPLGLVAISQWGEMKWKCKPQPRESFKVQLAPLKKLLRTLSGRGR